MWLNSLCNFLAGLVMAPFQVRDPWPALAATAFLTTIVLLLTFKACSNAERVRRTKGRLISRTLELLLFQHDPVVSLTACGRILAANFSYLGSFLLPIA